MTYDRLKAKPVKGTCCSFCGEKGLPMVKTQCCDRWTCCDTDYVSFRGGGYCQFQHERYSVCFFHYNEEHTGKWEDCAACKDFFSKEDFEYELNFKYYL